MDSFIEGLWDICCQTLQLALKWRTTLARLCLPRDNCLLGKQGQGTESAHDTLDS